MPELHILPIPEEAAQAAAGFVADLAEECVSRRGRFIIALSGGSTPHKLYRVLATPPHTKKMTWDRWHVFWGDERSLPPDHEDSNYRMAREALLEHVPIPPPNVHRIRGEVAPQEAAEEYETVLREVFQTPLPSFDLILLGIGEDGHTASLFPGTQALQEQHRLVLTNWAPHLPNHRITFTFPLINAASTVAFLATDESKAEVLRWVLEPKPEEGVLPAAMVRPTRGTVQWFLTEEASRLLKRNGA